jgi:hypothetical protein
VRLASVKIFDVEGDSIGVAFSSPADELSPRFTSLPNTIVSRKELPSIQQ